MAIELPQGATKPPPDLNSAVAAFLASDDANDDAGAAPRPSADDDADADDGTADDTGAAGADDDAASDDDSGDDAAADKSKGKSKVDLTALQAAIEKDDPKAFVQALGAAADTLLSGKAHKVLRLQVKEATDQIAAAADATAKATEFAARLEQKYGDPIAARKACAKGDANSVNVFIDLVEKWSGHSWNELQRWVASGIAGRPAALAERATSDAKAQEQATAKQAQAATEVRNWVESSVKKLDPALFAECADLVDLCVAEIKAGMSAGVNTPAKALPEVKKKLEAQYKRLHNVFGKATATPRRKVETPAARVDQPTAGNTRKKTMEELIAETAAEWSRSDATR